MSRYYASWTRVCYKIVFSVDEKRQQCCYNNDWWSSEFAALIVGAPYGGYVTDVVSSYADFCFKIRYEKMNLVCIFETMLCTTVLEFGVVFHCVIVNCLYVCRLMLSM